MTDVNKLPINWFQKQSYPQTLIKHRFTNQKLQLKIGIKDSQWNSATNLNQSENEYWAKILCHNQFKIEISNRYQSYTTVTIICNMRIINTKNLQSNSPSAQTEGVH